MREPIREAMSIGVPLYNPPRFVLSSTNNAELSAKVDQIAYFGADNGDKQGLSKQPKTPCQWVVA